MNSLQDQLFGKIGRLQWLSLLAGVLLFAVLNLLLTLLVHNATRVIIPINIVAAVLAVVIGPYLLRTIDDLQQTLTRQNKELRSLHAIDEALSARVETSAILDVAVRETVLAVDGEMGALWLFDEADAGRITVQLFHNISPAMEAMLGETLGERERGDAYQTREPVRLQELDMTWSRDRTAGLLKLRNTIAVPVIRDQAVLGVLWVANRGGTSAVSGFTVEDVSLLSGIASTLAVALQNARLYEETQRRGVILRTLVARTGEAVAASSDAPRLMQILADEAARIIDCPRVAVYAWDDAPVQLHPLAPTGFQPLAFHDNLNPQAALSPSQAAPLRIDRAHLPEYVTLGGPGGAAPYVVNVQETLGLPPHEAAFLSAPGYLYVLRARDRRGIGLLCLLDSAPHAESADRDAFAHALAAQAAISLENSLLAQQTQALLLRSQAMQEATSHIAGNLDTSVVLSGVMESARRVLEADGCALWDYLLPEADGQQAGQWAQRASQGLMMSADTDHNYEEEILMQALARLQPQAVLPRGVPSGAAGQVRSLLALPLVYGGEATGAMTLYYQSPRALTPDDIGLAQNFAHQAANALQNARLFANLNAAYRRELRIAETLQQNFTSLIPPRVNRFEFAHEYQAALAEAEIGGDFYDVFPVGSGKMGVVMADVSGKGLKAALQTAMIKYTLRAFAAQHPDAPDDVLGRVNDVLSSDLGMLDGFVTLFYGILDTHTGVFVYANAGHEAPFWSRKSTGESLPLPSENGLPLGCAPSVRYTAQTVQFAPGDLLALFTDGITEARAPDGEFLGADGLLALMPAEAADARQACTEIFSHVRGFAGDHLRDDVSLLLLRYAS